MSNANPSRLGQVNGAGAVDALWLKMFGGKVLVAFNTAAKFIDKHLVQTISSGKSAAFPATGKANAAYHTPGTEILGQNIKHNERVIVIDDMLIADVFVASIDQLKNHYSVEQEYRNQLVDALTQAYDKNVAQVAILAARASGNTSDTQGGTQLTHANYRTDSAQLSAGIFSAAQSMDEKDVPENDRFVFVKPAQFYLCAQNTNLINKDWAGAGSLAKGTFESLAGFTVVKTNNLPQTNVATGPAAYQGDFTNVAALAMQRGAVGTVKLLDLAMEAGYDLRRQGTLILAKYAVGHGILRPNCSVELKVA